MFPKGEKLITRYPRLEHGSAKIELFELTDSQVMMAVFRDGRMAYTPPGKYVKLTVKNKLWMSSTRMEYFTNLIFMDNAIGNILIGGLGLGLVVGEIMHKSWVESITVLENNPDVITLVEPAVRNRKVTILEADAFTYKPTQKFDVIYMDVWEGMTKGVHPDFARMYNRYRHHLTDTGVVYCWGAKIPEPWKGGRKRAVERERTQNARYARR